MGGKARKRLPDPGGFVAHKLAGISAVLANDEATAWLEDVLARKERLVEEGRPSKSYEDIARALSDFLGEKGVVTGYHVRDYHREGPDRATRPRYFQRTRREPPDGRGQGAS